jgi:hypothetical protein
MHARPARFTPLAALRRSTHAATLFQEIFMPNRRSLIVLAGAATAAACFASPAFAVGNLVDVQLVDRSSNDMLMTYSHRGSTWVAGRPGDRYAVRLSNRSGARVLVVLSIDGVNAISGDTAATGQTGYVLAPYQTTEITGWRKSLTEAAAFYFTALPDSYAARTGRPDNVGVIGAAVFRERAVEPRPSPRSESSMPAPAAAPAPMQQGKAAGLARDERLGTGHGEREYAPTTQTTFDRASDRPNELVRIRYDSQERLIALGVIPPRRMLTVPDPFPSFVPDPR